MAVQSRSHQREPRNSDVGAAHANSNNIKTANKQQNSNSSKDGIRLTPSTKSAQNALPHRLQLTKQNLPTTSAHPISRHSNGNRDDDADADAGAEPGPPAKRRKLSIRSKATHTQTTLDKYTSRTPSSKHDTAAPAEQLKAPVGITPLSPGGRLVQTVNGVRSVLDVKEDDVAAITAKSGRPPALDGLGATQLKAQPSPAVKKASKTQAQDDKRTLRSQDHDGPRLKSELAIYFPNYEDIIFDVVKEREFITVESTLYVTDDSHSTTAGTTSKASSTSPKASKAANINFPSHSPIRPRKPPATSPSPSQTTTTPLNLTSILASLPPSPPDPLQDSFYLPSHRRSERKEKQLRNIERERAMHEKVQLERLLDGLRGHDWLRVLGLTGITDGESRKFEAKRWYFVREVEGLVDKFREWRVLERRLRVEKGAGVMGGKVGVEEEDTVIGAEEDDEAGGENGDEDVSGDESSSDGPPSSDLNASAARQLQRETALAVKVKMKSNTQLNSTANANAKSNSTTNPKSKPKSTPTLKPNPQSSTPAPTPIKLRKSPPKTPSHIPQASPIKSFYTLPHHRAAALGLTGHSNRPNAFTFGHAQSRSLSRKTSAFGHPVPELEVREFELPEDEDWEEVKRGWAREKRRRKREVVADGKG